MPKIGLYVRKDTADDGNPIEEKMQEMFNEWFEKEAGNDKTYLNHQFHIIPSSIAIGGARYKVIFSLTYSY